MFQKINTIGMYVFIVIGVILMIMTMSSGLTPEQSDCTECGAVGGFLGLSYVLLILAIVAALAGAVMQAIMNPSKLKGSLIGLGGMLLVIVISYVLADGTVEPYYTSDITETASKWSGTGLYAFYILFVLAVLSIASSAVTRFIK
jgi:hypothetical protein